MEFVTIADLHFDTPYMNFINSTNELRESRRDEQKKCFKQVINYIKENKIPYLFVAGDLFESQTVRKATVSYVKALFKEISFCKIFIVPGNHDPYLKGSPYQDKDWSDNVKIFKSEIEKVEIEDKNVNIYGYGFNNYEMEPRDISNIQLDHTKINIFFSHGDLYIKNKYNSINLKELESKKFDYIIMGHIHKKDKYYPGSLVSLGFDESGERYFIHGKIENKKIELEDIKVDQREFYASDYDISDINSLEELYYRLNNEVQDDNFYEFYLVGYKNFEIEIDFKKLKDNILKVKDHASVKITFSENNTTLRGIFYGKLKEKLEKGIITEKDFEKALEIGINVLEK